VKFVRSASRTVLLFCVHALAAAEPWSYRLALPGYRFEFPRDHFDHPEFRTEWWYTTGNVFAPGGRRFGFELVFFRQAQRRGPSRNPSRWRVDDLYLAHAALTDVAGRRFLYRTRLNRAGPGLAGTSREAERIWNGNWSLEWKGGKPRLAAITPEFSFVLELEPLTPPVIHGAAGVSRKAAGPGRASHYVSLPRLRTTGEVGVAGARFAVTGLAWMDHEWFTHQLGAEQAGWDWFSAQFDRGDSLMLFRLRRKDGAADPFSAGTYIDASGRPRHLAAADFSVAPTAYWTSPQSGARYPVGWRIRVPSLALDLECRAVLDAQELPAKRAGPAYWEGAVDYSGSVTGRGYLEMTGYAGPVRLE
jgi:predicted secreted hydrolase